MRRETLLIMHTHSSLLGLAKNPLPYDLHKSHKLTPVWKCVKIEFPIVFWLNNLESLGFEIYLHTKDLLLHRLRDNFETFG